MIRKEDGQSLVEMALVIPILLLLVVGIFDLGRILYSYSALHFTAQETVRLGGIGKSDEDMIYFARNHYQVGDSSALSLSVSPAPQLRSSGDYITVELSYPIEPFIPVVRTVLPEQIVLRADATIRIE